MQGNTIRGKKYLWQLPEIDQQMVLSYASTYNLSVPVVQTLCSRGYVTSDDIESFLFSSFEKDVAHPEQLIDSQKAVNRIVQAIENKEKMLVFGDYDVDGITSSSLMMICLLPLGADINFLPHRVLDGYGLSSKIVERAARNNYKVIITVDNGITAFEPACKAKELGIDLIITDHHKQHDELPDAYAIVNPNRVDCPYPFKSLAGVGVTFKILSLLYERVGKPMPEKAYELLLLGTIADVVPLLGENRFWVRHGLNYVNKQRSFPFLTLCKNGRVTKQTISSLDIGFSVAPQINALGRLDDPRDGVAFLIGSDHKRVQEVGKILFELNQARKDIERSIFQQVDVHIKEKIDLEKENIILAASNSWPPGVIGLVASRLVSAYGKPTILLHITEKGIAKGSCRSIPAFNIFDALHDSKDLLEQFGGHAHAAGLALKVDNIAELKQKLEERVAQQLTPIDLEQKIMIDAHIKLGDLTKKFMNDINQLEPFGHANAQPLFYAKDVVLVQEPQLLKDLHVKCRIFADGVIKPLIFNRPELFECFVNQGSDPFDVAVQATENHWNGRISIELLGTDVAGLKQ